MNWNDYFEYHDGTLIWKVAVGRKIRAGDTAGTVTPRGYVSVTLGGSKYRAHRVIWEMHNGPIPKGMEIDHDDGKRANNKINNLKLTTNAGNHKNMAKRNDNTSGVTGVYFSKGAGKWLARIGKQHIGSFTSFDDAVAARKHHANLHGFSSRHGT